MQMAFILVGWEGGRERGRRREGKREKEGGKEGEGRGNCIDTTCLAKNSKSQRGLSMYGKTLLRLPILNVLIDNRREVILSLLTVNINTKEGTLVAKVDTLYSLIQNS